MADDIVDIARRTSSHGVTLSEAFRVWLRVAMLSFGGPAGQIAVMHRIIVDEKKWISENRFLHALNYCMLLPGPEAQQLATYIGWLMHRTPGGLIAGGLFILPGAIAITALSILYVSFGHLAIVAAVFFGLKAAVLAIVLDAVIRVGRRTLNNAWKAMLAAAAFIAIFFFAIPFPLVVLTALLIGFAGGRYGLAAFGAPPERETETDRADLLGDAVPEHAQPDAARSLRVAAIWLLLWLVPVGVILFACGPDHVFSQIAVFFSKMAMVTFGGAYAVLAYVAQQAVNHYGWLTAGEMLDGLGMAETTPGPLIMVLQFVGFLAAYRDPGALMPLTAGILGGLLATWVTFAPCFLWIFLGAPFIETVRRHRALTGALAAITAAVVGVMLSLAVWFAIHVIFRSMVPVRGFGVSFDLPVLASVDAAAAALTAAALVAIFGFRLGMATTLAGCVAAGILFRLMGLI